MEDKEQIESEQALFDKLTMTPLDYDMYAYIKRDMKRILAMENFNKEEKEPE